MPVVPFSQDGPVAARNDAPANPDVRRLSRRQLQRRAQVAEQVPPPAPPPRPPVQRAFPSLIVRAGRHIHWTGLETAKFLSVAAHFQSSMRHLSPNEACLLVLQRLWTMQTEEQLADLFEISKQAVSAVWLAGIKLLFPIASNMVVLPPLAEWLRITDPNFGEGLVEPDRTSQAGTQRTKVFLVTDCTEIYIQTPSDYAVRP